MEPDKDKPAPSEPQPKREPSIHTGHRQQIDGILRAATTKEIADIGIHRRLPSVRIFLEKATAAENPVAY